MDYPRPLADGRPVDRRVATVVLVDRRGYVLLQHRTHDAPVAPGQWGFVGGGIEGAETPEQAARRELAEETGLTVDGPLALVFEGELEHPYGRIAHHLFAAATAARNADVVLGEGQAIVFVDPSTLPDLDLASSAAQLLPPFLASPTYRVLGSAAQQ